MSIKIENTQVFGWEGAIRGARNPMNSWEKSDSWFDDPLDEMYSINGQTTPIYNVLTNLGRSKLEGCGGSYLVIGPNDHKLLMNLCKGGTEESKWRRMVHVQMDVTAPLYWWKEFETYRVGTVSNSCSTMHKIQAKEFTLDDFSCEHLIFEEDVPDEEFEGLSQEGWDALNEKYCGVEDSDFVDFNTFPGESLKYTIAFLNKARELFIKTKDKKYWYIMIQLLPTSYNQRRTIDLNYEVLAAQYRQRKDHKLDEWHQYCDWIRSLPYSEFITMEDDYGIKIPTLTRKDVELLRPKYEDFRKSVMDGIIPVNKEVSDWMNKMDAIIEEYNRITMEE